MHFVLLDTRIPAWQVVTVVLNSSQGLYILLYSVLANSGVRAQVRENITGVVSSVTTSNLEVGRASRAVNEPSRRFNNHGEGP